MYSSKSVSSSSSSSSNNDNNGCTDECCRTCNRYDNRSHKFITRKQIMMDHLFIEYRFRQFQYPMKSNNQFISYPPPKYPPAEFQRIPVPYTTSISSYDDILQGFTKVLNRFTRSIVPPDQSINSDRFHLPVLTMFRNPDNILTICYTDKTKSVPGTQ